MESSSQDPAAGTSTQAASGGVTVPTVIWPGPEQGAPFAMTCPNCRSPSPKPLLLTVNWITPDHPRRVTHVLRCPDCTCCFYDDQNPPDYTEPSLLERGRVPFYLQQGAGLSLITGPLARIRKPAGSTFLEVGCGFGFGLDFAVAARAWRGSGVDPAPLSALGRELLGVDIALRYFDAAQASERRHDVVMSSETLEHVPSPAAFLDLLAATLKPDGVLVLTTPNAERIEPGTPPGALVPLLSPGLHLVLQNETSLRALLAKAGLTHVTVERDSYSLVAFASRRPLDLEGDLRTRRARYRAYLEQRARTVPAHGDLFLAFAGRAVQESANDGDLEQGQRVWELLAPVCKSRFGLDLDALALPPETEDCTLERMAELMPLNLPGILYGRAMLRLAGGERRGAVEGQFLAGAAASGALRRALHDLAIDDVMAEELGWICRAEACLCAADRGAANIVERLAALPLAPGGETGSARRSAIALRAFVALVNAGHYDLARTLSAAEKIGGHAGDWHGSPSLSHAERDALFCLAVLDLQAGGDPARARRSFQAVRLHLVDGPSESAAPSLFWAALRGEILATRVTAGEEEASRLWSASTAELGGRFGDAPADLSAPPAGHG